MEEFLSFLLLNNFTLTIARLGSAQFHTGAAWNNEAYFTVSAATHTPVAASLGRPAACSV